MNEEKVYWAKIREDAIIPTKRPEDAGYDIYACFDEKSIVIHPHETKCIPTGIASAFSSKYVMVLKERGSTGTKGIGQRCGVIDSGYRGEYIVPITNHNNKPLIITKTEDKEELKELEKHYIVYTYKKAITQGVLLVIPEIQSEEISYTELQQISSERGTGKLGSSGK